MYNLRIYRQPNDIAFQPLQDLNQLSDSQLAAYNTFVRNCDDRLNNMYNNTSNWKIPILIHGYAGSGKTFVIHKCKHYALSQHFNILVTTPTGFLACKCKEIFGNEITTDTIHAAFGIPVQTNDAFVFQLDLFRYDLIVIDEISMISERNFNHIYTTIRECSVQPFGPLRRSWSNETHRNAKRENNSSTEHAR